MSVMSAIALARREQVQTQLAQGMKRLQGRANFRRRVRERLERRKFSTALDAAVQGEESLRQKRWDDAIGVIDALGCNATEKERADAFSEEREAYDAWYEFTLPSSRQRFEFILRFKLAYEDR